MRMLPDAYNKKVEEMKKEISQVSHVALTSDLWTSRTTESYITITCHFLTATWELMSLVLETLKFDLSHTAQHIADALLQVADNWNISTKVVAIVTDNASNIVAAVKITGWIHVPCFAHTLNLIVSEAIKSDERVNDLKKRCKQIVTFFHQSVKATEKLKEVQFQLKLPEHKLIQEVDTRWNSTFYMFERILEQHQAITTALCLNSRNELCLSLADVKLLEASLSILQPFEAATREISADKYVSISKAIPLARSLQHITAGRSHETTLGSELSAQMRRRYTAIERAHLLALSTLMDPRLKKMAFSNSEAARQGEQWITQEAKDLITAATEFPAEEQDGNMQSCGEVGEPSSGLWEFFDKKVIDSQNARSSTSKATVEVRTYFGEDVLPRLEDPLSWWKINEKRFSLLSQLAKKYLSVPGTSVPSERLFSKAGELVSIRRNRLKAKNVNMMLFLNKNM
ncbi:zinc finger BED domain-containing protein 4-like [Dendronephthya gigantea]|uniref:zinc finger BED domain-containing protein 4-like n=1 Tax=Dendronephthya gigantea TaxID=151771 RepID=UPI00106C250D|nr:zinc finger BED domain-containing protein 4-like [Dendronephthya gigantea]